MPGETGLLFPDERRPRGLLYEPERVSRAEEVELLDALRAIPLEDVRMRGQLARRKVAHFGVRYAYGTRAVETTTELPEYLVSLRARCAPVASLAPELFEEALVTRYPPGAGIGWHRDAPSFGPVVLGASLGAPCRMRFRPYGGSARGAWSITLDPRSVYVISGVSRTEYEHSIPPLDAERWSVSFRTIAR